MLGPGTSAPSTAISTTRLAFFNRGSANRMQRAVSVLAFQCTSTVWPIDFGASCGAMSTGLPLSNSAASIAVMRAPRLPGRPSTVTSCTRPRLPSVLSSIAGPPRQRKRPS